MESQRKIAMGLLVVCTLAVLVGVLNAFNQPNKPGGDGAAMNPSVASLLNKRNHLVLVELTGPIFMDSPQEQAPLLGNTDTNAVTTRKALDEAAEDKSVKGVLLRIDSPGGTVGMSQELNAAVQRVSKKKPIVATLGDMAASGGYYTACAADKIVTNPGTLTASIGVIISTLNMKNLFENKLGIRAVTVKSGKFKDILSPYRDPSPEETALVQRLINDSYQDFLGAVLDGRTRHFTADQNEAKQARIISIKSIADGRVVNGRDAVRLGLADEVGDLQHAYKLLDQMAKERFNITSKRKLPLETIARTPTLLEMLGFSRNGDAEEARTGALSLAKAPSYKDLLPLSLHYPNQPLWILE